jgi:CheY-like chemotaxis protein
VDPTDSLSHILLAEDNPADVGLVREALREHGIQCQLQVLSDGEVAMAFIDCLDADASLPCPDVFLLDLHLPKQDGTEVLRHLRASPRCGQTPVVIFTAAEPLPGQEQPSMDPAVRYFQKPNSLGEFLYLGRIVKDMIGRTTAGD